MASTFSFLVLKDIFEEGGLYLFLCYTSILS